MILKISLRAKGGVPKTLLEQKHRLNFLYFPQNTLMLTESREEFSDLHSIFRLRALRYCRVLALKACISKQPRDSSNSGCMALSCVKSTGLGGLLFLYFECS